jgi:hypothetical protein
MNAVAMDDAGNAVVVWGSVGAFATTAVTAFRFFVATSDWAMTIEPLFTSATPVVLSSLAAASHPDRPDAGRLRDPPRQRQRSGLRPDLEVSE